MPSFAQPDESVPTSPKFRLVAAPTPDAVRDESTLGPTKGGVGSMISAKLLIAHDEWSSERQTAPTADRVHAHASIPLVSSLARIRSEADAALALTGVLELIARRFHITLPVGADSEDSFHFDAPEGANLSVIAETIDDALLGVVRATDLQGALRERLKACVERVVD